MHRLREQIKSERKRQRELDGRGDYDLHRFQNGERQTELDGRGGYDLHRFRNVKLTEMNVNAMSVCGSTYCLSERRSMELSIMLDLT